MMTGTGRGARSRMTMHSDSAASGYEYWVHSYWQQDGVREDSIGWVEDFFAALQPHSSGAVYVNDLENEGDARVRAAYGDGNRYARLAAIKHKYDPANFFRINQNIKPSM